MHRREAPPPAEWLPAVSLHLLPCVFRQKKAAPENPAYVPRFALRFWLWRCAQNTRRHRLRRRGSHDRSPLKEPDGPNSTWSGNSKRIETGVDVVDNNRNYPFRTALGDR